MELIPYYESYEEKCIEHFGLSPAEFEAHVRDMEEIAEEEKKSAGDEISLAEFLDMEYLPTCPK